ncbi:MAG: DUF1622 domain-containing protein [Clostridia bacterium]|nr:DUF1622 domain-containing protein [Clostridia bacterium]
MEHLLEFLETIVHYAAKLGIVFLELTGIIVLIVTAVKCIYEYLKHDDKIKVDLAQGIALALEFKLGGEVLHTVLANDLSELLMVAGVMALRTAITLLLHWEINSEKQHLNEKETDLLKTEKVKTAESK